MAATISPGGHHAARAGAKLSLWAVEYDGTFPVPICFQVLRQSHRCRLPWAGGDCSVSIGTIILIILVIALLGGFSGIGGGPFYGTGYYGGGGLGLVIVILLILLLLGRL
jgi:hypothetical protein